jgi:hypothetical protein
MVITIMRRLFFIVSFLAVAQLARAAVPALLNEALQKTLRDTDRWAFTQTLLEYDGKDKEIQRAVVRFDPSKPYAEQYTPISINGKAPTASDLAKYRKRGEKRGDRMEKAERDGSENTTKTRQTLGEVMDIENATVASETATTITYEVPLKKEGNRRFPPDKFQVLARVNKATHGFERIEAKLRESMRSMLIVKIKSGEGAMEFSSIDPKFAPALVALHGGGSASVAFVPIGRRYDVKHEDFKRVRPFGDRFDVQIGTMKALDF